MMRQTVPYFVDYWIDWLLFYNEWTYDSTGLSSLGNNGVSRQHRLSCGIRAKAHTAA